MSIYLSGLRKIKPIFKNIPKHYILQNWKKTTFLNRKTNYTPNRIKKAIIKPNRAIASVNAKPNTVQINKFFVNIGLREIAKIRDENTKPIPTPEPASEMVAKPAPITFADCSNIFKMIDELKWLTIKTIFYCT